MSKINWADFFFDFLASAFLLTATLVVLCPLLDFPGLEPPRPVSALLAQLDASPSAQKAAASVRRAFAWRLRMKAPSLPSIQLPPPSLELLMGNDAVEPPVKILAMEPGDAGSKPRTPARPAGLTLVQNWGVIVSPSAPAYSRTGKYLQRIGAGTLLDISELWQTKSGSMALCNAFVASGLLSDVLIYAGDMDMRPGPLSEVSAREKDLRCQLAELLAQRTENLRGSSKTQRTDNPHYAAYAQAQADYVQFWKKARDLQARRDSATGDERSRLIDELARLTTSGADVRVGDAFVTARREYNAWNADHPQHASDPSGGPASDLDRRIAALRAELDSLPHNP